MPLPDQIAAAIEVAPRFTLLGLSMRDERMRDRARWELALFITERLESPVAMQDRDQLKLPLE